MKRKRYLALGLALAAAVGIGLVSWGYSGSASAHPGMTCNPEAGHGTPGCHVAVTTTTAKPTTTTAKATTTTAKATTTTAKASTTTTKGSTGTTAASTTTTAGTTDTTAGTTETTGTTGSTTTITVPLAPAEGTSLSDVPSTDPYYTQISDMVTRQVMSVNADGTFGRDLPVTRQDFARMIVKALGLTVTGNESSPFTDVAGGADADPFFPDKYVAVCFAQGITVGKTATTFAPDDNLTRQQLVTMAVRAAKLPEPPADFIPPFTIGQFYPEEHYVNARKAASAGLLEGVQAVDFAYNFVIPATRGEVAVMLYNLLNR
jgi:hypothetical protein